jgi:hypothetical protein
MVLEYEGDFDNMEKRLDGMRRSRGKMRRPIGAGTRG